MKGLNKSTITRWVDAGRLVIDASGNVLVAESEARLSETADPAKHGVVKRHERERGEKPAAPKSDELDLGESSGRGNTDSAYGRRVTESARREAAEATLSELKLAREQGKVVDREGVDRALADHAVMVRQALEKLPYDLAQVLAAESDPTKVREILQREVGDVCRKIANMLRAMPELQNTTAQ